MATAADLPVAAGGADRLLVEAKPPPGATRPGGNAVRFDWSLLRGWHAPVPWILAGGLTAGQCRRGDPHHRGDRRWMCPPAWSATRGVKDPALIRAFIANARASGIREG